MSVKLKFLHYNEMMKDKNNKCNDSKNKVKYDMKICFIYVLAVHKQQNLFI